MKIMIDTNIFLDVLLDREKLAESSATVLNYCEKKLVSGCISASCVTDIFYIVRKYLHSTEKAYEAIGNILKIAEVCPVTDKDIIKAYEHHSKDFEDCLLAVCSVNNGCDRIITRNKKDYIGFEIPVLSPEEFISVIDQ